MHFDISWDEVAKYVVAHADLARRTRRRSSNRYPDRFLFGTDEVAPHDQAALPEGLSTCTTPLWKLLTPEASEKVRKGNYERLFDEARRRVRAWEKANLK